MINEIQKIIKASKDKKDLSFFPSKLATISLPVSKPKSLFYEKTNGRDTLAIASGEWKNPKTKKLEHIGLPYGIIPRHILLFLAQEYHRNLEDNKNPRIINFPTTIPAFLEKLGYEKSGSNYKRIYEQTFKLFEARIAIYRIGKNYILKEKHDITKKVALWWDPKNPEKKSLFNCMVEISKMTEELIKTIMPLRLSTIRKIGGNCLEFDLYSWLNLRHFSFSKPYTISWEALHEQFGANYTNLRDFKIQIKKAWNNVLALYKHNSKLTAQGILLQNSSSDIITKNTSIEKKINKVVQNDKSYKKNETFIKKRLYADKSLLKKLGDI